MDVFVIVLLSLVAVVLLIAFVYLFFLVRPRKSKKIDSALLCKYAHRGLHSLGYPDGREETVPENSLAAFELACQNGFGIELDIQLSRDGVVMVFHDYTLVRMTGCEKKLCELDSEELQLLSLAGTDQKIPTFKQVLDLIDGRVPILVELKGEDFNTSLCEKAAELLSNYKGKYCIESFNPLLVGGMKKYLPDSFRGLLYTNVCREKKKSMLNRALTAMALNFVAKPNFIAFNKIDRDSLPVRISTGFFHAPKFVWTVKSIDEFEIAEKNGEFPIFEQIRF